MATTYPNPQALLRRYPAVNSFERAALVAWVRGLRPAALVTLLADRRAEPKLLAMRANEPELKADGRWLDFAFRAAMLAGVAVLLTAGLFATS